MATPPKNRGGHDSAIEPQTVLNSTGEGIYVLDPGGVCLWSNAAAARIFGYKTPAAYLGKQMHAVVHHTHPDGTPFPESECSGLRGLRAGGGVVQSQELLWRANGTSFYAEVRVNPIFQRRRMQYAVVVFRDITEKLHLEEQFRHAQKMETVGRVAAGAAHDFNNLLTVISGYAQLLLADSAQTPAALQRLRGIHRASARAAALTRQLLAFSRLEPSHPMRLDLNGVIRCAEALTRSVSEGVRLHLELSARLPEVRADAHELEQVLLNLVVNACDAMPQGGELRIRTRALASIPAEVQALGLRRGRSVELEISDTGTGMDEATRRQMFEPFFTTKPPSQGTGLGLAMVMSTVRQYEGAIAVVSQPGRGTRIRIYLPAVKAMPLRARVAAGSSS